MDDNNHLLSRISNTFVLGLFASDMMNDAHDRWLDLLSP
jgi:hypothetical protein